MSAEDLINQVVEGQSPRKALDELFFIYAKIEFASPKDAKSFLQDFNKKFGKKLYAEILSSTKRHVAVFNDPGPVTGAQGKVITKLAKPHNGTVRTS